MLLRHEIKAGDAGLDDHLIREATLVHEEVVHRAVEFVGRHSERHRECALGIEVDQEHPAPVLGKCCAQAHRRRGLADATLPG